MKPTGLTLEISKRTRWPDTVPVVQYRLCLRYKGCRTRSGWLSRPGPLKIGDAPDWAARSMYDLAKHVGPGKYAICSYQRGLLKVLYLPETDSLLWYFGDGLHTQACFGAKYLWEYANLPADMYNFCLRRVS